MAIPIDRELKIKLLEALKMGFINFVKFPELTDVQPQFDLDSLTLEERALFRQGKTPLYQNNNKALNRAVETA